MLQQVTLLAVICSLDVMRTQERLPITESWRLRSPTLSVKWAKPERYRWGIAVECLVISLGSNRTEQHVQYLS